MKTRGFDTSRVERGRRPRKESSFAAYADETSAILSPPLSLSVAKAGFQLSSKHYSDIKAASDVHRALDFAQRACDDYELSLYEIIALLSLRAFLCRTIISLSES